jgi:hypothetical protein
LVGFYKVGEKKEFYKAVYNPNFLISPQKIKIKRKDKPWLSVPAPISL